MHLSLHSCPFISEREKGEEKRRDFLLHVVDFYWTLDGTLGFSNMWNSIYNTFVRLGSDSY